MSTSYLQHARYGKGNVRVFRVVRDGKWHHVVEYNVTVLVEGDIETSYTEADNSVVVATDSMKNITYYLAKVSPHILNAEKFAIHLGTHIVSKYEHLHKAFITIEQLRWARIPVRGEQGTEIPHAHSFLRDGDEKRVVNVEVDATKGKDKMTARVSAGLTDLLVLKTTGSAFSGFVRDEYTTLVEVEDRIFSTSIDLIYTFSPVPVPAPQDNAKLKLDVPVGSEDKTGSVWDEGVAERVRKATLDIFATDESASVQATLFKMGQRVIGDNSGVQSVTYTLPNKHYIPVDMKYIGIDNLTPSNAEVFMPIAHPSFHQETMGGDHKCPVCQATFTRPQHVARHMRSHTGDRPYKCLYCGDQFARSDLLSRHCNKCHANEKPLTSAGTRRRGSASAARATTSKQACDQCVQSSLPCDGSNPCGKCVQRKCRCTYVKFHRQTAPVGPGHSNPRPATSSGVAAAAMEAHPRLPMYGGPQHPDDLMLGHHQGMPSMAGSLFSESLGFSPLYTQHGAAAEAHLADGSSDYGAMKFRQQPDPYRRASLPVSIQASATVPGAAGLNTGLYADPRQAASWMPWGQENDPSFISTNPHSESIHDKNLQDSYMGTQAVLMHQSVGEGTRSHYADNRDRRGSLDYNSEGSSATSHSVPSSATSSSAHLPMETMALHQQQYPPGQQQPTFTAQHDRVYVTRPQEGTFSSAFGLMSLEDQNVLAGLANDSAPFFSQTAMEALGSDDPNQTPMPGQHSDRHRSNAGPPPSKEAEIRELREFWKQYIRTPLSGPGPMGSAAAEAPRPQPQRHTPSASRRPRVASLPNTKSPFSVEHGQPQKKDENNPMSSIRTTLHAQEDLRSYEAAVLARKAPTTLSLGPRARRNNNTAAGRSSQTESPQVPTIPIDPNVKFNYSPDSSRPSSAAGVPVAMAHWSGKLPPMHLAAYDQVATSPSPPSRGSSVDDSGGSDREGARPSFKRLPSTTLGPPNTKRAQVSHEEMGARPASASSSGVPVPVYNGNAGGGGGGGGGADNGGGNSLITTHSNLSGPVGGMSELGRTPSLSDLRQNHRYEHPHTSSLHHTERPISSALVDRHRRMSAPNMPAPSLPAFTFVSPPGPGPGGNP